MSSKQQLKYFKICISSRYIKIIPLRQQFKTQILIQRKSGKTLLADKNIIYQQSSQSHKNNKNQQIRYACLIMGVITIQKNKFLVYVKSVYPQEKLPKNHVVYQIAEVDFIPFVYPVMQHAKQLIQIMQKVYKQQQIIKYNLQDIFSFSFYFSFDRDLTLSYQEYYERQGNNSYMNNNNNYYYYNNNNSNKTSNNHNNNNINSNKFSTTLKQVQKNKYFWNYEMLLHMIGKKQSRKNRFKQTYKYSKSNSKSKSNNSKRSKSISPKKHISKKISMKQQQKYMQQHQYKYKQHQQHQQHQQQQQQQFPFQSHTYQIPFQSFQWLTPIIQGYFNTFCLTPSQHHPSISVSLLTRRSKHHSGTRFYNRGIDQFGHVAHFIQTQLIIFISDNLISCRFFTGSIPVFWQQTSQLARVKLTREKQLTEVQFGKHVKEMVNQLGNVFLVNLLQKKKDNQYVLIKQFEYHVKSLQSKNNKHKYKDHIKYAYFDLNYHQKSNQFNQISQFLSSLIPITLGFKWFHINTTTNTIYSKQKGVYRISCLDCLNRTNIFLQLIGLQVVYLIMERFNLENIIGNFNGINSNDNNNSNGNNNIKGYNNGYKKMCMDVLTKSDDKLDVFLRYYRALFEEKAQFQSIIYAGTSSTKKKSKFINQIQNTFISMQRFLNQKFVDRLKQLSLDSILYYHNSSSHFHNSSFRQKHKLPFNIQILTWNVNALNPQNPQHNHNILKMLEQVKNNKNDMIIFGIQQMIELNTNNIMNDNTQQSKQSRRWEKVIENGLGQGHFKQINHGMKKNKNKNNIKQQRNMTDVYQRKRNQYQLHQENVSHMVLPQYVIHNDQVQQQYKINNYLNDNNNQTNSIIDQKNTTKDSQSHSLYEDSPKQSQYIFVQKIQMVGLFLIIFISKKWIHSIKQLKKDFVKTGIKLGVTQKYGNKGGVIIRINIFQTSIAFICSHLSAHQNKIKQRVNDFNEIHEKGFRQDKQSVKNEKQLAGLDYRFFFGDLNFRLEGEFKQLKKIVQDGSKLVMKQGNSQNDKNNKDNQKRNMLIKSLMKKDQLYNLMNNIKNNIKNNTLNEQQQQQSHQHQDQHQSVQNQHIQSPYPLPLTLCSYKQPRITFLPTYKLQKSTGLYSLQKSRNPSYCDRIIYSIKHQQQLLNIQQLQYSDVHIIGSDHKPVKGRFRLSILKNNVKADQSVIMEENQMEEGSEMQ